MTGRFAVQVNDGQDWVECIREDLLEDYDGRTGDLPPAQFDNEAAAQQFIVDICELIHMGGNPDDFRIVAINA